VTSVSTFRPPAGRSFFCPELIPLTALAHDLRKVAAFLQAAWPDAPLNLFADWWQHDGLHFHTDVITFHTLFTMISSPRAIYEAMPGDDDVRVGVAPARAEWYLRFYAAWDDDGEQIEGDYELTLPAGLADTFRIELLSSLQAPVAEEDAENYFKRIIIDYSRLWPVRGQLDT
jgi:hypothetical protein